MARRTGSSVFRSQGPQARAAAAVQPELGFEARLEDHKNALQSRSEPMAVGRASLEPFGGACIPCRCRLLCLTASSLTILRREARVTDDRTIAASGVPSADPQARPNESGDESRFAVRNWFCSVQGQKLSEEADAEPLSNPAQSI
jgi:hypothetical protein